MERPGEETSATGVVEDIDANEEQNTTEEDVIRSKLINLEANLEEIRETMTQLNKEWKKKETEWKKKETLFEKEKKELFEALFEQKKVHDNISNPIEEQKNSHEDC